MKNTSLAFSLILIFGLLTLDSCKKEDPVPEPTKSEILTNGIWNAIRAEYYEDNILESTEILSGFTFEFKTNGKGIMYENGVIDYEFTWSFNSDKTKLYFDLGDNDVWAVTIELLTKSKFTFSDTEEYNGVISKDITFLER